MNLYYKGPRMRKYKDVLDIELMFKINQVELHVRGSNIINPTPEFLFTCDLDGTFRHPTTEELAKRGLKVSEEDGGLEPFDRPIDLLVSENRTVNLDHRYRANNMVRVFVNNDYGYGLFIHEETLYQMLDVFQRGKYSSDESYEGGKFQVPYTTAQKIIELGVVPPGMAKQRL